MIRIPARDIILEQGTLNRIAQEHLPKTETLRSLNLELLPGLIRLHIDGTLPLVGNRTVVADLSVSLQGNELWLRLEKTNVPLIPKAAIVSIVASQANINGLRAEGASLVLNMVEAFAYYELQTQVNTVHVEQGSMRVICLIPSNG
ncbi:MAG: hypothetical protein KY468_21335 [Armatimonadetes bacterium]|nr:hypothetical protein [Armatimonadota bacterium]